MDGVDCVLGAHLLSSAWFGTVSVAHGPLLAGGDLFEFRVIGKAGHGGTPQLYIDPVFAAAQIVTALQSVVARETRPGEPLVVSINAIQGGSAANVTVEAIARGVGEGLRVQVEFEIMGGAPVTANVPEYATLIDEAVAETGPRHLDRRGRDHRHR